MAVRIEAQDDYHFWRRALVGHKDPVRDGEPEVGFYRMRNRSGADSAVAYFRDGKPDPIAPFGRMICTVDGKVIDEVRSWEVWSYVARSAVTHEHYQHRIEHGRWPNESEAVVGHNRPPAENTFEGMEAQIDALAVEAKAMIEEGAAKTQEEADKASDIANSFGEIQKQVVALHKAEKEPHLQAGRAVDKKWFPLRDSADNIKTALKRYVVTPFLLEEKAKQAALLEKAEKLGVADRVAPEQIGAGSLKRTVALRTQKEAKIVDIDRLWMQVRGRPEVIELMQRLANAAAKAGNPYPGTEVIETEVAQ